MEKQIRRKRKWQKKERGSHGGEGKTESRRKWPEIQSGIQNGQKEKMENREREGKKKLAEVEKKKIGEDIEEEGTDGEKRRLIEKGDLKMIGRGDGEMNRDRGGKMGGAGISEVRVRPNK